MRRALEASAGGDLPTRAKGRVLDCRALGLLASDNASVAPVLVTLADSRLALLPGLGGEGAGARSAAR